jgi:hypothetical protein
MGAQPSPDRLEAFPRFVNVGRERSRESQESDTLSLLMPAFNERRTARQIRYWLGNLAVTLVANVLYGVRLSDIMTCYKAMPAELFRSMPLEERGFGIEPEITAGLVARGVRIHEVPVAYAPRARSDGKKLTMTDGLRVVRTLLRCRFDHRRPSRQQ